MIPNTPDALLRRREALAAIVAIVCLRRVSAPGGLTREAAAAILRSETDILRGSIEEQSSRASVRTKLGHSLTGFPRI